MKRLFLVLALFGTTPAFSRIGLEMGLYGECFIRNHTPFDGPPALFPGGLVVYLQLGKFVTFDYRVGATGYHAGRYGYVHAPAPLAAGSYFAQKNVAVILLAALPEGFGFYLNEDHNGWHLAVDMAGIDYYHERGDFKDTYDATFSVIGRYRFTSKNGLAAISPYAGFSFIGFTSPGLRVGTVLSLESPRKKEEVGQ